MALGAHWMAVHQNESFMQTWCKKRQWGITKTVMSPSHPLKSGYRWSIVFRISKLRLLAHSEPEWIQWKVKFWSKPKHWIKVMQEVTGIKCAEYECGDSSPDVHRRPTHSYANGSCRLNSSLDSVSNSVWKKDVLFLSKSWWTQCHACPVFHACLNLSHT